MERNVAVVFTGKSVDEIVAKGGSASWRLNRRHARQCSVVVCTRNSRAKSGDGGGPHGSAFLVGKVSGVVELPPKPGRAPGRYLIEFSDFARVDVPHVWKGKRNPIQYVETLEELGIEPNTLQWEPMPERGNVKAAPDGPTTSTVVPLTIPQAKQGLSLMLGVSPEAIEIIVRG
jgi:hypothetical protein